MMELPVYIDGKREGSLRVERQGTMTAITAQLRDIGRVVRLSVYGEKAGYLGIPEPAGGGTLRLEKRFTPMEMLQFPQRMEYAADRPLDRERAPSKPEPVPAGESQVRRHVLWMGGKPYFF